MRNTDVAVQTCAVPHINKYFFAKRVAKFIWDKDKEKVLVHAFWEGTTK